MYGIVKVVLSMAGVRRRSRTREERRSDGQARILEAARALFKAEGVAGLSVRAIARKAGMPAMTLYSYYPSKMAIVRALWADAFAPLFTELDAAEAAEKKPKPRLRRVARTFVEYWLRYPERYKVVFLIEDRRESDDETWFVEQADVAPELQRFARLIGAVRGIDASAAKREGEAMMCALIGISHLLVGVKEYPWGASGEYVDLLLRAFG